MQFSFLLDDVGIPQDYRHMEGFGVHTFTMINKAGQGHLRQVPLAAHLRCGPLLFSGFRVKGSFTLSPLLPKRLSAFGFGSSSIYTMSRFLSLGHMQSPL